MVGRVAINLRLPGRPSKAAFCTLPLRPRPTRYSSLTAFDGTLNYFVRRRVVFFSAGDFLRKFILTLSCALFFFMAPFCAGATQPCRVPDGCIDEASASLLLALEISEQMCSEIDPEGAPIYKQKLLQLLRNEDPRFLERLRASEAYTRVKAEIEARARKRDLQSVLISCKEYAKQEH